MLPMPAPLPDEFVTGHAGRLFLLNKISDTQRSISTVSALAGNKPGQMKYLEVMAQLSRTTVEQYAFCHTLAPFYLAVHSKRAISWKSAPPSRAQIVMSARRGASQSVNFCPECAEEDRDFWGYSYWRRSHQFPGLTWCSKHHCALHRSGGNAPLQHLPEDLIHTGAADEIPECEISKRYGVICADLMQRDVSVSTHRLTQLLQAQAGRKGVRVRLGVINESHLDDLARLKCDSRWINQYFPDVFTKGRSSSLCRTYSSVSVAYGSQYYALALALLFDNADEASLALSLPPDRTGSAEQKTPLSNAMTDFLGGVPLLKAIHHHGAEMDDLERWLRATFSHAQPPVSINQI